MPNLKTYQVYFTLLTGFLVAACCGNNDLVIHSGLADTWLPYKDNQTIDFLGEKKDTITFTTARRSYLQEGSDKACGDYQVQTEEIILTSVTDPNFKVAVSISHEIVLNINAYTIKPSVTGLEAKFNLISEEYITHAWRDTFQKEIVINGETYPQLIRIYGNQIGSNLAIYEILYSPNKGLIGFRTFAGGQYFKI